MTNSLHSLKASLALPVIAAPMFLVSGPELVMACCLAGIVGSFPAANARTSAQLDEWLTLLSAFLHDHPQAAPFAVNIILYPKMNDQLEEQLALVEKHRVPYLITSVGNPAPVVQRAHAWGGKVLHDVVSVKHARKAAEANVDGLILVCAGSGGHTGQLNPFAFVEQVRRFWAGGLVVGGSVNNGRTVRAIECLGADLAYAGTAFINARPSMAPPAYKEMLAQCTAADVMPSSEFTGIHAHFLRPSIIANQLDPERLDAGDIRARNIRAWKDVWSAGHGVGNIPVDIEVQTLVDQWKAEYEAAR